MSEILFEGATGSVVTDVESAVDAVMKIGRFDRSTVRALAVERFSSDRMVDEYVNTYRRAIAESHRDCRVIPTAHDERRLNGSGGAAPGGFLLEDFSCWFQEPAQVSWHRRAPGSA
jgi:hypothetical protein